jgi:hypothetical protein
MKKHPSEKDLVSRRPTCCGSKKIDPADRRQQNQRIESRACFDANIICNTHHHHHQCTVRLALARSCVLVLLAREESMICVEKMSAKRRPSQTMFWFGRCWHSHIIHILVHCFVFSPQCHYILPKIKSPLVHHATGQRMLVGEDGRGR